MAKEKTSKLNQKEKISAIDFLFTYGKGISSEYGQYNWDDKSIISFCTQNNIKRKGNRKEKYGNFFWFDTKQIEINGVKTNDKAHHFLRHIRNAIAHGNIRKENKKIIVDDYQGAKQTMHGEIPCDLFWTFIEIVQNTKN